MYMAGSNLILNRTSESIGKNKAERDTNPAVEDVSGYQDKYGIGSKALYTASAPLDHLNHGRHIETPEIAIRFEQGW